MKTNVVLCQMQVKRAKTIGLPNLWHCTSRTSCDKARGSWLLGGWQPRTPVVLPLGRTSVALEGHCECDPALVIELCGLQAEGLDLLSVQGGDLRGGDLGCPTGVLGGTKFRQPRTSP